MRRTHTSLTLEEWLRYDFIAYFGINIVVMSNTYVSYSFIKDMENKIRNTLNEIYFGKTNSILNGLRSVNSLSEQRAHEALKSDLAQALQKRQKGDLSN